MVNSTILLILIAILGAYGIAVLKLFFDFRKVTMKQENEILHKKIKILYREIAYAENALEDLAKQLEEKQNDKLWKKTESGTPEKR